MIIIKNHASQNIEKLHGMFATNACKCNIVVIFSLLGGGQSWFCDTFINFRALPSEQPYDSHEIPSPNSPMRKVDQSMPMISTDLTV